MDFEKYKILARKVFPDLPIEFNSMEDTKETFLFMFNFTCPKKLPNMEDWDWSKKHDYHSLANMTATQIRNIDLVGHSCWNKK